MTLGDRIFIFFTLALVGLTTATTAFTMGREEAYANRTPLCERGDWGCILEIAHSRGHRP